MVNPGQGLKYNFKVDGMVKIPAPCKILWVPLILQKRLYF